MRPILNEAFQDQVGDMHSAQEILNVLDELSQQNDLKRDREDSDADWHKPEANDQKETYDEVAAGFVAEDRARMLRAKVNAKLDAELDEYYKRKYDDTKEAGAASSSSTRAKRQAAEQQTQMEVDEEAAEESVDYTGDVFEC